MSLPTMPIPAPGFVMVSGLRNPPDDGAQYEVQFRSGYVDDKHLYTASQLRWVHSGDSMDVVAVRKVTK